jgi:hypothetical protein
MKNGKKSSFYKEKSLEGLTPVLHFFSHLKLFFKVFLFPLPSLFNLWSLNNMCLRLESSLLFVAAVAFSALPQTNLFFRRKIYEDQNSEVWGQFHQRSTCSFYICKLRAQLFCAYI